MASLTYSIRWLLMLVFTVSFAVLAILLYRQGWKPGFLVTDALLSAFLLTAAVWTSSLVVKAYPTRVGIVVYGVFVGAACGLFVWFADMLVLRWWFEADREYHDWIQKTADIRLALAILTNSWMGSLTALNNRSRTIEAEFRNMTDATTLHREAELFKLRQQLQPHFLYNSLNSISALIMIQPEKAQEMIGSLSDFLRNSVKREGREQIPVAEELQYIGAYLAVEAVRFGDRLKVVYDKGFDDKATMPPFLLQPILENAIKFGLYGHSDAVVIEMKISLEPPNLVIRISNPVDDTAQPPRGTGFGLEGIRRRLYLLFGRTDLLETHSQGGTFTTTLKIPQPDA